MSDKWQPGGSYNINMDDRYVLMRLTDETNGNRFLKRKKEE